MQFYIFAFVLTYFTFQDMEHMFRKKSTRKLFTLLFANNEHHGLFKHFPNILEESLYRNFFFGNIGIFGFIFSATNTQAC